MNKSFQLGWWLAVITIICVNVIGTLVFYIFPEADEYVISGIGEMGILIPILTGIFYLKKNGINSKDSLALYNFNLKALVPSALMTVGGQYFITFMTLPIQSLLIILFGVQTNTSLMEIPDTLSGWILSISVVCVIAPIFEELLCRGILMKLFEKYGLMCALISTSLIFALMHFELRSFIQVFFIGLIFGIFRICTGSTKITIILHSLNNLISLCQLAFDCSAVTSYFVLLSTIIAIAFPIIVYYTFVKFKLFTFNKFNNDTGEKTGFSFGALICFLLFFAVNFILLTQRIINNEIITDLGSFFS